MLAIHLKCVGMLMFALVLVNFAAARRFAWRQELQSVSLFTRQAFFVHLGFILLLLVMFGVLSLCFTETLLEPSSMGALVLAGLSIFWGLRLITQWFVYSRKLWWGHRFNTWVHVALTAVWIYFTAVYGSAWWRQVQVGV